MVTDRKNKNRNQVADFLMTSSRDNYLFRVVFGLMVAITTASLQMTVVYAEDVSIEVTDVELKEPVLVMPDVDSISGLNSTQAVRINLPTQQGHILFSISDVKTSIQFDTNGKTYRPEIGMKYLWLKLKVINNSYTEFHPFTPDVYVKRKVPNNSDELLVQKNIFKELPTFYQTYYERYQEAAFSSFSDKREVGLDSYVQPGAQCEAWVIYEVPYERRPIRARWWLIKGKVATWNIEVKEK